MPAIVTPIFTWATTTVAGATVTAAATAAAITGGIGHATAKEQTKAAEKMAKRQQAAMQQRELEAGEHWEELNREQMEMQSQMSQIKLLSDIITTKRQQSEPVVLQLPAAKTYTPAEQINAAIDDFLKRG